MSEAALPQIKVTESPYLDESATGTSGVDSPTDTKDGAHSTKPRSVTSSEGNLQPASKNLSLTPLIRNDSGRETGSSKPTSPTLLAGRPSTAIDPLSHHILKRTHTENTIPQKLRNVQVQVSENPNAEAGAPVSPEIGPPKRQITPEITRSDSNNIKDKKKGVSFLSRFSIIGGKKKDQLMEFEDDESELGDHRTEGMNAHVFSSSIGANGFIPQHKEPPRYIKVRAHNKRVREFDRMFLAQELAGSANLPNNDKVPSLTSTSEIYPNNTQRLSKTPKSNSAVWAAEFSKDGRYLAAAGRDQLVRVWAVISTHEEREAHEHEEDLSSKASGGERLSAPVFRSKPVREFEGHTGDVLDLSWSKNNFLLSSSMDKTVRLWHISRQECLCTFKHKDFVTSIAFHPKDDRFFLAGSLDSVLRLWSIPDKSVAFWNQLPDLITAVAFTPDGKSAMAGVLSGLCLFYETEGLKYNTQIHVRSSRGKNAKGSKITGIRTMHFPPDDPEGEIKVLITSNDSRVRMYNLRDKSLEMKFRGHENTCSQINASFSDDSQYVICGSEDRKAYIWNTGPTESENKDKRPLEMFEAHSDMVTAAVMAPTKSRQLLSASGDPIYDLCNPPPVTLLSREESNASSFGIHAVSEKRHSDTFSESQVKKPEESPAYLARCTHMDGNIFVTADYHGCIKVFRQDCAYHKRRHDNWETGSTFSKKMLGRTSTIRSRTSASSQSRRNSVSQTSIASPNLGSDHIISWRSNIENDMKSPRMDRSISPGKFSRTSYSNSNSQNNLAQSARQQPYASTPIVNRTPSFSASPPPSLFKVQRDSIGQPPTPGFTINNADNPLRIDEVGKSNQFWNLQNWKSQAFTRDSGKLGGDFPQPSIGRSTSVVSKLSSEASDLENKGGESDGEALSCKKCGGKDFRARKGLGKSQKLVCTKCGTTAE